MYLPSNLILPISEYLNPKDIIKTGIYTLNTHIRDKYFNRYHMTRLILSDIIQNTPNSSCCRMLVRKTKAVGRVRNLPDFCKTRKIENYPCGMHQSYDFWMNDDAYCHKLIKTGRNKGKICGKLRCRRHGKLNEIG